MKQFKGLVVPEIQKENHGISDPEKIKKHEAEMQERAAIAKKNTEERKKKMSNNATRSNNNLFVTITNQSVNYNSSNTKYYFEFYVNIYVNVYVNN
jgi:hypothetical protein